MSNRRIPFQESCRGLRTKQAGFNLVEVLIALLVLALGLLGLAALQNMGLRANYQSYERTQATILIDDMIDRMRANPAGVVAGDYTLTPATGTAPAVTNNCETVSCLTSSDMATYDKNRWITAIAGTATKPGLLAAGKGSIAAVAGTSLYDITVSWQEENALAMSQTVRVQLP